MQVRDSLKALMALKRVNKRDLSEGLTIPWNTLNRYISGQSEISADKFVRILNYLDIDIIQILNQKIKDLLSKKTINEKVLHDIYFILSSMDEIDRKVYLQNLLVSADKKYQLRQDPQLKVAINGIKELTHFREH